MANILPNLNLRKNQTSELSYPQVDNNWTVIGTAVDANTAGVAANANSLAALRLADYTALRALTTDVKSAYVTGYVASIAPSGIAGVFVRRDDLDPATAIDNGGTRIVGAFVWDRVVDGKLRVDAFGVSATAIQAAINSFTLDPSKVNFGAVQFKPGVQYNIGDELLFNRAGIIVEGNNCLLKWSGNNAKPMIHVKDSSRCRFENMALLGDYSNPPTAAIYFEGLAPGTTVGTNENIVVDGLIIGRKWTIDTTTGGTLDPTPAGRVQKGIWIGGVNGDNDEYHILNTEIHSCDGAGIQFDNDQSIWSKLDNTLVNDSDTGVRLGCNVNMYNVNFNRIRSQDIIGFRDLECNIFGLNSENSNIVVKSQSGADFFMSALWVRRGGAAPGNYLRWENGGSLVLENSVFSNINGNVADTIYYRSGSGKGGVIRVRNCTIANGNQRNTWDVDTNLLGTITPEIDIESSGFRFKTTRPYADKPVTPTAVAAGAALAITADPVIGVANPYGNFYNISYSLSLQGQHLNSVPMTTGANLRGRLFNPTAGSITLGAGRMRWLDVGDRVQGSGATTIDVPTVNNLAGYSVTVPVAGAQLGDYAAFSVSNGVLSNFNISAYVSAEDTVTVRLLNTSGGPLDPPSTTIYGAKVAPFGLYHGGQVYTPSALTSGTTTSLNVTAPGAQLGAHVFVAYTKDLQGLFCTAHVSAQDTVTIVLSNYTGASVTLAAGSFKVMVAF